MLSIEIQRELKQLHLVTMKCFSPSPAHLPVYNEIYRVWRSVWEVGVRELYGQEFLPSDQFIRQDFVAGIFRGDVCLASCCYRLINLSIPAHVDDSWFKPWPRDLVVQMAETTPMALMPSWLSVNPDFRRKETGYPIHLARIMMEVLNYVTIQENAQIAFGVSRNDRSVNKVLRHIGGVEPVCENVTYEGFSVDLFKFTRAELEARLPQFSHEVHKLWRERIDLRPNPPKRSMPREIDL